MSEYIHKNNSMMKNQLNGSMTISQSDGKAGFSGVILFGGFKVGQV